MHLPATGKHFQTYLTDVADVANVMWITAYNLCYVSQYHVLAMHNRSEKTRVRLLAGSHYIPAAVSDT